MFCEFCGKQLSNGANFCPSCGNSVKNEKESVMTEEPVVENCGTTEILEFEDSNIITESCVKTFTQNHIKGSNHAKTASICAIFAPVSILIAAIINFTIPQLFLDMSYEMAGDYNFLYRFWQQFGYFLSGALCLGIYIGVFLVLTGRHRKELPFFLFLLAPGCYSSISWIANLFYGFVFVIPTVFDIQDTLLWCVKLLLIFAEGTISYFIVRGIFKRILSKKD